MNYPPMVYSHLSIHATWWNSREEKDVHLLALQMLCRFIAETGSSTISRPKRPLVRCGVRL